VVLARDATVGVRDRQPAYVPIFTADPAVRDLVWSLAVVVAASQPIGALLYVLDGILIGAGDTRYLAWTMLAALLTFLPIAGAVLITDAGIIALWWALAGWLLARQVAVALRDRSGIRLRTGHVPGRRSREPGPPSGDPGR